MNTGAIRIGNLLGKDIISSLNPQKEVRKSTFAKPNAKPGKTTDYPLKAIYPAINLAQTMENYRQKVHLYNLHVDDYNALVDVHNSEVEKNKKNLNELQKTFVEFFIKKHAKVKKYLATNRTGEYLTDDSGNYIIREKLEYISENVIEYNKEVDATLQHGYLIEKRHLQKIKTTSEKVFQQMVFLYNVQLTERNKRYMELGVKDVSRLPKMEVNSWDIATSERNGVKAIDLHKRTIRRHRKRLTDAGILVEYEFCSNKRPIKTYINPEIISVFDLKTNKYTNAQNQEVTSSSVTNLPDSKGEYKNYKDKSKIKENGKTDFQNKGVSASLQQPFCVFTGTHYQNTVEQDADSFHTPRENFEKNKKNTSEILRNSIISTHELAERLTNDEYVNYTPIDIRVLYEEAYKGGMSREEFRELAIQDFFKTSAKLYRGKKVYFGSWYKAIVMKMNEMLISFTGNSHNKHIIAEYITELRWRLEAARKFCIKNPEYKLLFPSEYFDSTRMKKGEGGFEYTKALWQKHQKNLEKYEAEKKQRNINAKHRKQNLNESKLIETKVNQFLKDKITLDQLYDYVIHNYPNHLPGLATLINKKTIQYKC